MAKEARPQGRGKSANQGTVGKEAPADSKQAGEGSDRRGVYINERGEVCYGNECVTLAVDQERNEIRVNIKRSATCDVDTLVESLREVMGTGARTVYEVESEVRDK